MQVSLERRPGSVVELSIEVPTEQVERAIETAFSHLAPNVRVAGFRPGKAPRPVLEREIGWPALREHALEHLVPDAIGQAVAENKLDVIATPQVEVQTFERLQPARLRALVTVKPEVTLGDPAAISAPMETVEITDSQVDESLQQLREGMAELAPAPDRGVQKDDHLVIDLNVTKAGAAVDEAPAENLQLEVNPEALLPGLYEGLEGMKVGETKSIPVHLPDDYRRAELAGQEVDFGVTLKEVKEPRLPEADDELAKLTGVAETLTDLREVLRSRLQAAAERDAVFGQQKRALDALVAASTFEVPELLVDEEIHREIRNLAINLGQQGIDFDRLVEQGGLDVEKMHEERRPTATERVREELVLDALAERQGLVPSDEHVAAEATRTLEGADDAERLVSSDRVQAYVRERMRLQWALLWLAATARGEDWTPPGPGEEPAGLPEAAAAAEVVDPPPAAGVTAAAPVPEPAPEATPESEPPRADGMVDI
ncbi:MAG: trigger factor [Chloroflexota bacterium]|jgi:trigger factor|nr:trigger factor [Chloroflexota bacterium]